MGFILRHVYNYNMRMPNSALRWPLAFQMTVLMLESKFALGIIPLNRLGEDQVLNVKIINSGQSYLQGRDPKID